MNLDDVRRTPYVLGGRAPGQGLDCLGTVLVIARRMGLCAPDPWQQILEAWELGGAVTSGFPSCWFRLTDGAPVLDGDVLLFFTSHPWSAIVCAGNVWSADPSVGVYCRPLARWERRAAEVWRHDPTAHQEGPAR